jgi:hypothetical protein
MGGWKIVSGDGNAAIDKRGQVLHLSVITLAVLNIGCAFSPSVGSLIALRFLGMYLCIFRQCAAEHERMTSWILV